MLPDLTTTVVPRPASVHYPAMLEFASPVLRAYPRETVVAEKFQAMVVLGIANSRMKDFFDLWTLAHAFAFDGASLGVSRHRFVAVRDLEHGGSGLGVHYPGRQRARLISMPTPMVSILQMRDLVVVHVGFLRLQDARERRVPIQRWTGPCRSHACRRPAPPAAALLILVEGAEPMPAPR